MSKLRSLSFLDVKLIDKLMSLLPSNRKLEENSEKTRVEECFDLELCKKKVLIFSLKQKKKDEWNH